MVVPVIVVVMAVAVLTVAVVVIVCHEGSLAHDGAKSSVELSARLANLGAQGAKYSGFPLARE
jgi:hypothetical protein